MPISVHKLDNQLISDHSRYLLALQVLSVAHLYGTNPLAFKDTY